MGSARDPEEPKMKGKPGPEPERLVIDPDDAEAGIEAPLKNPKPMKGEKGSEPKG